MNRPYYSPNRGGKRSNQTGRPKEHREYSQSFKDDVLQGLELLAELTGKTFGTVLAETAWGVTVEQDQNGKPVVRESKVQDAVRIAAQKLVAEVLVVKESKHAVQQKPCGPTIFLPAKEGSKEEEELLRERGYVKAEKAETDQVREDGQGPVDRRSLKH